MKRIFAIFNALVNFTQKYPKRALGIFFFIWIMSSLDKVPKTTETPPEQTETRETTQTTPEEEKATEPEPIAKEAPLAVLVDLPALFGLDIDQLREQLAAPETVAEYQASEAAFPTEPDGMNTFTFDIHFLMAHFDKASRTVDHFTISTMKTPFTEKEKNDLLIQFNISENSKEYKIKATPYIKNKQEFTDIVVRSRAQVLAKAEKEKEQRRQENEAIVAEIEPMLHELKASGLIMKITPTNGEVHVNPAMWKLLPFDQKETLATAADQYLHALPNNPMGLWGIVDGFTGKTLAKISIWRGFTLVE